MRSFNKIIIALALIATLTLLALLVREIGMRNQRADTDFATHLPELTVDYELTSHEGRIVRDEDFAGQYQLIYFGFAFCPDICPFTLDMMASALERIGTKADQIQPIFISLDPARDTVDELKSFIGNFYPDFIALTGAPEAVDQAAKSAKVFYQRVEDPASAGGYVIDHSSIIYLFGPDGRLVKFFTHQDTVESLTAALDLLITE